MAALVKMTRGGLISKLRFHISRVSSFSRIRPAEPQLQHSKRYGTLIQIGAERSLSLRQCGMPLSRGRLTVQNGCKFPVRYGQHRCFRTTKPSQLHPVLTVIVKITGHVISKIPLQPSVLLYIPVYIKRILAFITGRLFRKKWKAASKEEQKKMLKYAAAFLLVASSFILLFYWWHYTEEPLTGRKRFGLLKEEQIMEIAIEESKKAQIIYGDRILPQDHPDTQLVIKVVTVLLRGNEDIIGIEGKQWRIAVVNDDANINAFVLPNGDIYVFTGLLKTAQNIDQLAIVLAHELSHCILHHGSLKLNQHAYWEIITLFVLAVCWAITPVFVAVVTHYFFDRATESMFHMPYSRQLEEEADEIGLQLAAKACFDVRESSVFWNMMHIEELKEGCVPSIFDTHPTSDSRADMLDQLVPKALELRTSCKCPPLQSRDSRAQMKALRMEAEANANQPPVGSIMTGESSPAVGGLRVDKKYVNFIKEITPESAMKSDCEGSTSNNIVAGHIEGGVVATGDVRGADIATDSRDDTAHQGDKTGGNKTRDSVDKKIPSIHDNNNRSATVYSQVKANVSSAGSASSHEVKGSSISPSKAADIKMSELQCSAELLTSQGDTTDDVADKHGEKMDVKTPTAHKSNSEPKMPHIACN